MSSSINEATKTSIQQLQENIDKDASKDPDNYSTDALSDDDFILPADFNLEESKKKLLEFSNCSRIVLDAEQQREIQLEIGVNLTNENPWKQIKKNTIINGLSGESKEIKKFLKKIKNLDNDEMILVGYVAELSEDQDTFIFFENIEIAREASEIIEQIEVFERRRSKNSTIKYPRKWKSLGSENVVDLFTIPTKIDIVDVEIQSIYRILHPHEPFQLCLVKDLRDGYVELIPQNKQSEDYVNIIRKRVDAHVQSAPSLVNLEQQTDPTFPSNAWSQYLYEINPREDEEDDPETPVRKRKTDKQAVAKPIVFTDKVDELLETLKFNEVDMYRNDYPIISTKTVDKFEVPCMNELLCFADITKTVRRMVTAIVWHPFYTGIIIVSYTFTNSKTITMNDANIDEVKRTVLEHTCVLMWSIEDNLTPKYELETSREITSLSCCPYDENIIIGGTINGQLIIWDLQDCLAKPKTEENLTPEQLKHRTLLYNHLSWTKQSNQNQIIKSAAMSDLQTSHKNAITQIIWLKRQYYVTSTGGIRDNSEENTNYRYFVTSSMDCTIAFWNLDYVDEIETKRTTTNIASKLPNFMRQQESQYNRLNQILRPQFIVVYNQPISQMIIEDIEYLKYDLSSVPTQTQIDAEQLEGKIDKNKERIIVSTFLGDIVILAWEGTGIPTSAIKKEIIKNPDKFCDIHDGPIYEMANNPFIKEIILSIGRNILAIWHTDLPWSPLLWRRYTVRLTSLQWSQKRPSVFIIGRDDGSIEIWDLLCRTDKPSMIESLSGSIISVLSENPLPHPENVIAVGDFNNGNSTVRMLVIPKAFSTPLENERECLQNFIDKEVARKEHIKKWQENFYQMNTDIREAKIEAATQAKVEFDRLQKEFKDKEDLRQRKEADEVRRAKAKEKNKAIYDLPERLEKKWDDMNIKRLMKILMAKKMVDPALLAKWTKPEKDRVIYNKNKRLAISESFRKVTNDLAELRARLLPIEENDEDRIGSVAENLKGILLSDMEEEREQFKEIEERALKYVSSHMERETLTQADILQRGYRRRELLNKNLGSNTQHRHNYYTKKKQNSAETQSNTINTKIPETE